MTIFDPIAIKKKSAGKICSDCGKKPAEANMVSVQPYVMALDRCVGCFKIWAGQVRAVHRAMTNA
jgi:hypothetical protein